MVYLMASLSMAVGHACIAKGAWQSLVKNEPRCCATDNYVSEDTH